MKSLVFLVFLSLSLVACSGGSGRPKSNESCDSKWKPGTLENPKAKEKVDSSDSAKSLKMNAGDYETKSIRLYYFDKSENVRIDITIKPNELNEKTGTPHFALNCARGIKSNLDTVTVKLPYAAKVVADANGETSLTMSELTFVLNIKAKNVIEVTKSESTKKKSESLKDIYPKDADTKHILYKVSETKYESRVQLLGQGRKDSKSEERSLDVRAYINYDKVTAPETTDATPVVLE